ncbi:MAG: peptidoglycan-binding domain-containing protein [Polyangiales bacterium]
MADQNIQALQEALALCGYTPGSADGKMGPRTRDAIRDLQRDAGIAVDGDVGPNTRAAIAKRLGETIVKAQHLKGFFEGGGRSIEDEL